MRAVVESVEGKMVRCLMENGDILTVGRQQLPDDVKEGDVIKLSFTLDTESTKRQKELMAGLTS
ncbi:MAG TPA: DUF3006 domain-containing protein [Candidatus Ozemobacteraceae bacterium]|nr:DUF3006 domain-containing protein [Candidatus Ozemobacteraceae bacterium]